MINNKASQSKTLSGLLSDSNKLSRCVLTFNVCALFVLRAKRWQHYEWTAACSFSISAPPNTEHLSSRHSFSEPTSFRCCLGHGSFPVLATAVAAAGEDIQGFTRLTQTVFTFKSLKSWSHQQRATSATEKINSHGKAERLWRLSLTFELTNIFEMCYNSTITFISKNPAIKTFCL